MQLLNTMTNFLHNQAYGKNTIIMLIGSENTIFTAYSTGGFNRTINIPNTDSEFFGKYRSFLHQFKGWDVILLVDDENIKIKSEELPILQSIIKTKDHVNEFVFSAVSSKQIVAHERSKGQTSEGIHIENVTLIHTNTSPQLVDIISFIYNFNFPLVGIYILAMEMKAILEDINTTIKLSSEDKFTIFITPTLASGIRVFIFNKGGIYSSKTITYPHGKSQEYLAGLIEQIASEVLAKHKKYIATHNLSVEIISLSSVACAHEISKQEIHSSWRALSWEHSKPKLTFVDFSDEVLIHNLRLKHPASNKALRQISSMEKFNHRVLNLSMILIIGVFLYAGFIEYKILRAESKMDSFSSEYYKISEEYREARKKLQSINNLSNIYDIISDIAILKSSIPVPIEVAKHIVDIKDNRANISSLSWKLTKDNIGDMQSELVMSVHYEDTSLSINALQKHLDEYQVSLTRILPNYQIELLEDQKGIINIPNKVMIPVRFTIKGPSEDK